MFLPNGSDQPRGGQCRSAKRTIARVALWRLVRLWFHQQGKSKPLNRRREDGPAAESKERLSPVCDKLQQKRTTLLDCLDMNRAQPC
jgi:hypothetical protein